MTVFAQWNGFQGRALQMDDYDLPRIGHVIGVGEDVIHALLDVESRGEGFRKDRRPVILREEHYFWKLLPKSRQQEAVNAGLAWPTWRRNYPKDSYTWLQKALEFDERAALMSCSWGIAQIMGANFAMCGYATVKSFVRAMMDDEALQLEAMVSFLKSSGLDDELRALEAATTREERIRIARLIARGYNGPGYAKNNYHTRIVNRLEFWQGKPDTPWSIDMAKDEQEEADKAIYTKKVEERFSAKVEPKPVGETVTVVPVKREVLERIKPAPKLITAKHGLAAILATSVAGIVAGLGQFQELICSYPIINLICGG